MADATSYLTVVSSNVIGLTIADLVIYIILLFPTVWITWLHGKPGMTAWPLYFCFIGLRFVADVYQLIHRNETLIPGAVVLVTIAGSITCLTLALIGVVYEVNMLLPLPAKPWLCRFLLAAAHLVNVAGICLATYGGAPTQTGGFLNVVATRVGNILQLVVLLGIYCCVGLTFLRIWSTRHDPVYRPSMILLWGVMGGTLVHILRVINTTTYAFTSITSLDPVTGSFAVKLVLIFGTQLVASLALVLSGWFGVPPKPNLEPSQSTTTPALGEGTVMKSDTAQVENHLKEV